MDVLIPSNHDFIWRAAYEFLASYFPDTPHHQLRVLLNNPIATFNPGTILVKEKHTANSIVLLLSGSVEAIHPGGLRRSVLSSGALIGELSALFGSASAETYRAIGFVKGVEIPSSLYREFVRCNNLSASITRIFENREFLQRTALFGEMVSTRTLNRIAKQMSLKRFDAEEEIEIGGDSVAVIVRGRVVRTLGGHVIENLQSGDFFGEEQAVFWTPSLFKLRSVQATELFLIPASLLCDVPSVRWKLFEAVGKRMISVFECDHTRRMLLTWHDEYRVEVLRLDTQHRHLFEQANAILDAISCQAKPADMLSLFDTMAEYARYHFGEEESLLSRHNYPETQIHRDRHASLLGQLMDLRDELSREGQLSYDILLAFLHEWLVNHIINEDRRYSLFLNERGVY